MGKEISPVFCSKKSCDKCGEKFPNPYQLYIHQRIHRGLKPFRCKYCGKDFASSGKLRIHENRHTGLKPYSCNHCERKFTTNSELKVHKSFHGEEAAPLDSSCVSTNDVHAGSNRILNNIHKRNESKMELSEMEKTFSCDDCGEEYPNKYQLTIHQRIHKGLKPYRCKFCRQDFASTGKLRIHESRHTGLRPHKCNNCERTFVTKWDLSKHEQMHSDGKPYNCKYCGKGFVHLNKLTKHTRSHSCDVCGENLNDLSDYNCHKKLHKAEKSEYCASVERKSTRAKKKSFICQDCGTVMNFSCTTLTNVFSVTNLSDAKCFMKNHTVVLKQWV